MKFSINIAIFAAFATVSAPYVSAQTLAPSPQESNAPSFAESSSIAPSSGETTESIAPSSGENTFESIAPSSGETTESIAPSFGENTFESIAPSSGETTESIAPSSGENTFGSIAPSFGETTFESGLFESSQCSTYPVCSALGLTGDCCPTVDDVVLDCCSGVTPVTSSFPVTLAPSGLLASTPAPSSFPVTSAPSGLPASTPAPSSFVDTSTSTPVLVSIIPMDTAYKGCMEDSTKNNRVYLNDCDSNKLTQKFKYDGTHIRTGSDENMCLQASYDAPTEEAEWIRVMDCDSTNSLQKFTWDVSGGEISVTDSPTFCLTFRGVNDNINSDFIRLTKCRMTDYGIDLGWKGVA